MFFKDSKNAISWYIVRSHKDYSSLGAVVIGDDAGVDISITNDGYDDVDTMIDIEKILNTKITKLEKTVILYHAQYGRHDTTTEDGKIIRGSFSKFRSKICPVESTNGKLTRMKYNSESYFKGFIRSIEHALEIALVNAGYIEVYEDLY